jgi:hypothetical protein
MRSARVQEREREREREEEKKLKNHIAPTGGEARVHTDRFIVEQAERNEEMCSEENRREQSERERETLERSLKSKK